MNDLIFGELIEALEKARQPRVYTNEEIAINWIKDWLPDLEEKYPEQVQLIRDALDTIEE